MARHTRKYSTHMAVAMPTYSAHNWPGASAAISSTSSRPGMASTASASMTSVRSTRPPRHAASTPSRVPGTAALSAASTAMPSDSCVACASRASHERPSTSVPSQCSAPGRASWLRRFCSIGLASTSQGPSSAHRASRPISTSPVRCCHDQRGADCARYGAGACAAPGVVVDVVAGFVAGVGGVKAISCALMPPPFFAGVGPAPRRLHPAAG